MDLAAVVLLDLGAVNGMTVHLSPNVRPGRHAALARRPGQAQREQPPQGDGRSGPRDRHGSDSGSLADPARPQARSADPDAAPCAVDDGPHPAQIRFPAPPCDIVRVADRITVVWTPTADLTLFSHGCSQKKLWIECPAVC